MHFTASCHSISHINADLFCISVCSYFLTSCFFSQYFMTVFYVGIDLKALKITLMQSLEKDYSTFFSMRIGYETTSALSGAIIPHPLHAKAFEQNRSCRPSCLWKHWLSWGETVASCLLGSALVSDRFVFLKSRGIPELDFLSPMHAPPPLCLSREAEPCV